MPFLTLTEPKTIYKCPKHKYSLDRTGYCKICGSQLIRDIPPYVDKWAKQRALRAKRKVRRLPSPNDPTLLIPTINIRQPEEIRTGKYIIRESDRVVLDLADTPKTKKYLESRSLELNKDYIVDYKSGRGTTVRLIDSDGNWYVGIEARFLKPLDKRFESLEVNDAINAGSIMDI